jgi:hypothetical protein
VPRPPLPPPSMQPIFVVALLLASGCGGPPEDSASDAVLAADPSATQALRDVVSKAINDTTNRYKPLDYEYDEDLLVKLDQIEAHLADPKSAPAPRFMAGDEKQAGIDAAEELEHHRESVRRWAAKAGRSIRSAIDPLKAEVAGRKPDGPKYYPEFHKRFAESFDDYITIEVAEIRERRNRALHAAVKPEFDKYRATHPELVRHFEAMLNAPPYVLPPDAPPPVEPAEPPKSSRADRPGEQGRAERPLSITFPSPIHRSRVQQPCASDFC